MTFTLLLEQPDEEVVQSEFFSEDSLLEKFARTLAG